MRPLTARGKVGRTREIRLLTRICEYILARMILQVYETEGKRGMPNGYYGLKKGPADVLRIYLDFARLR